MDPATKTLTDDSFQMANILQEQYKSVFTTPKPQFNHPDLDESQIPEQLDDIEFTEDFIRKINTLDINSEAGSIGFPAILLKKNTSQLAKPLNFILRNILD